MKRTRRVILLVACGAVGIGAALYIEPAAVPVVAPVYAAPAATHALTGHPAPDFSMRELARRRSALLARPVFARGEKTLRQHSGRVIVLNFWATWCSGCVMEQGEISDVARKYAGKVQILGILVDDTPKNLVKYLRGGGDVSYPLLIGGTEPAPQIYSVRDIPQTFIIDSSGAVRQWFTGTVTEESLSAAIQEVLAGEGEKDRQRENGL